MIETFVIIGHPGVRAVLTTRLKQAGFEAVEDVEDADAALTYCTSQTYLEDVYFDDDGLVQRAASGTVLIDLSPSTPNFARELNAIAVVNDSVAVEAPLVVKDPVRVDALARENLWCLVGGDEALREEIAPLLNALADEVTFVEGGGQAQLAKAVWSLQTTAQIIAAIEGEALCRSVSKGPWGCVLEASDICPHSALGAEVVTAVKERRFDGAFTVEMLMADLTAALTTADDIDLILPQAEAAQRLLELMAVIGGPDRGVASLALIYRDEEAAAQAGLDWSRAETAFGIVEGVDDYEDELGEYEGDENDGEGGYRVFGFGGYSAN